MKGVEVLQKGSEYDQRHRWPEYLHEDSWTWKKIEEIITVCSLKKGMITYFFSKLGCKHWHFGMADLKQVTVVFKKTKGCKTHSYMFWKPRI